MPLLIAALLAVSAALIVLYPLLGLTGEAPAQAAPARAVADTAERERQARQALREVEFDYTLGNLAGDDYEELRDRYETRALAALKTRYQREQELDALIERQLDALRQSESVPGTTSGKRPQPPTSAQAPTPTSAPAPARREQSAASGERPRSAGSSVRDRRAPKRRGS